MEIASSWIGLEAGGSDFRALAARPAAAPPPLAGVVVLMEVWGIDHHIEDLVARFAAAGYAAIAPDLFSLGGTPDALAQARIDEVKAFRDRLPVETWMDPGARQEALDRLGERGRRITETIGLAWAQDRDWDALVAAMRAAVAWLASGDAAGRGVSAVGFCLGGRLAMELACEEPALAGAVSFYGGPPREGRLEGLACPLLGIYGADDPMIMATLPGLEQELARRGKAFEKVVYPGAPHAFFNDTRPSFRVEPSRDAWARTLAFLAAHA